MLTPSHETQNTSTERDLYRKDGYVIAKNIFTATALAAVSEAVRTVLNKGEEGPVEGSLDHVILAREQKDHSSVYRAAHSVGSSAAAYQLLGGSQILNVAADIWQVKVADVHTMPMYLLVQFPSDERFDYVWHQDATYYTWCREMLTLWFPITHRASLESGTIGVIPGSHSGGKRPAATTMRHGFFRQIESEVGTEEPVVPLQLEVGDCCIMHAHSVHRTVPNRGSTPRVTGIVRLVNLALADSYEREAFYCVHKS